MAHTITSFAALARVGLKEVVDLYQTKLPAQYTNIIGAEISTRQQFERFAQISDFGYASNISEADGVPYDDILSGYTADFYPVMRATGFQITKQAKETDLYNKVKEPTRKLVMAMRMTTEAHVANTLNNGFSTSYTGIDSVSLFSTAHPLASGTSANRPSTDYVLSALNLESALQSRRQQKTHRGLPYVNMGAVNLIVPPPLWGVAQRITESDKLAQAADNDKNWMKSYTNAIVCDFLTSNTAWFLLPTMKDQNPIFKLNRLSLDIETDYDIDHLMHKFAVTEEYVVGWKDWRGTYGTTGA